MMKCPSCDAANEDAAESCFTCGRSLYSLTRGAVIANRYVILTRLGHGAMGTVYWAHDRMLEEHVAVKVLRPDIGPEMAKRFRSEIKLARRISHKNVCRIHEYGEENDLRYICMAFVEGTDLKRLLKERGPLPSDEAFDVALQTAEGLQAIHDEGIVHRDLKSSNIMMDERGVVKLMDFGIAKQIGDGTSSTATGDVLGTPEYMSPEQARGERVDARSDIYALGIVVFEIFTGEVPFHADTPVGTALMHLTHTVPLEGPRALRLPKALLSVLRKSLAKDPRDRFATAQDFAHALRHARRAALHEASTSPTLAARGTTDTSSGTPTPDRSRPKSPPESPDRTRPRLTEGPFPHAGGGRSRSWLLGFGAVVVTVAVVLWLRWGSTPVASDGRAPIGTVPLTVAAPPSVVAASAPTPTPRADPTPSTPTARPVSPTPAPTVAPSPRRATAPPPTAVAATPSMPPPTRPAASLLPSSKGLAAAQAPPQPAAAPTPAVAATGLLQLRVRPWADISVDGEAIGTTPLRPLSLAVGSHRVRLVNPKYQPLERVITVEPGGTTRLEVDLGQEGEVKKP